MMDKTTEPVTPMAVRSNAELGFAIERIHEVGETLLGTCKSADEVIQNVFGDESLDLTMLPIEALHKLDEITMECQVCNWWFEPHELNDDQVCEDCA